MLFGELIYRGINPDELPVMYALAYTENRDTYYDWQKGLWQEAAQEIFGQD